MGFWSFKLYLFFFPGLWSIPHAVFYNKPRDFFDLNSGASSRSEGRRRWNNLINVRLVLSIFVSWSIRVLYILYLLDKDSIWWELGWVKEWLWLVPSPICANKCGCTLILTIKSPLPLKEKLNTRLHRTYSNTILPIYHQLNLFANTISKKKSFKFHSFSHSSCTYTPGSYWVSNIFHNEIIPIVTTTNNNI